MSHSSISIHLDKMNNYNDTYIRTLSHEASIGNIYACFLLGIAYFYGLAGLESYPEEALFWFKKVQIEHPEYLSKYKELSDLLPL